MRTHKSYTKQIQQIADDFYAETQRTAATKEEIAKWAIRTRRWEPHPDTLVKQCAEELARAMREQYITDPQGRRVRAKHAAAIEEDGKQKTLWTDMRFDQRDLMERSFRNRRQQIVGDCYQLKKDVDSFNDNYNKGERIPLLLDFMPDVEELEEMAKMRKRAA